MASAREMAARPSAGQNSTHREILVIDGRVAFTGGAGISEWWAAAYKGQPPWRDTMVRVEGPIVASRQAVFAENWLACRGGILAGDEFRTEPALRSSEPDSPAVSVDLRH
jgi:phosphatidylserine/phosphatidylglycerophosphate/cardiolipin synthase-like enzyme